MEEFQCFLVDDDVDDLDIFFMALEDAGEEHTCITAKDGVDALDYLNAHPDFIPDFIFLDLNMPRLSGKGCLMEIKKVPRLKNVRVVIYTTSSRESDVEEVKKLGASHFFVKPPSIAKLTHILNRIFHEKDLPYIVE